jgi:hypothetical protein
VGANSGNLTKRWVDAFVTIGETAVNDTGDPHTFTITATAIPSGASPVRFSSITTSLTPVPETVSSTCDTPTVSADGLTATCTLTVNSSVAGVFVANATARLSIGGTAVVRSTDSAVAPAGPGGSGPATKTYVAPQVLGEVIPRPTLPRTGADVLRLLAVALLLVAVGSVLVVTVRRRRSVRAA